MYVYSLDMGILYQKLKMLKGFKTFYTRFDQKVVRKFLICGRCILSIELMSLFVLKTELSVAKRSKC